MMFSIGLLFLIFFQCIFDCLASSCGEAAIPFSFEALPSGHPVLGCARPSCFGWTLDNKVAGTMANFYRINRKPDGYVRAMFNYTYPKTNLPLFTPPVAKCSQTFENLSCNQKANEWVGGIAPLLNVSLYPLVLQCCTYEKLRKTLDRGIATVNPGQMVIGGEVFEGGRLYAFDYISNIEKRKLEDESIYYEVYMRRMQCLPYPKEFSIDVEQTFIENLMERALNVKLKSSKIPAADELPLQPNREKHFPSIQASLSIKKLPHRSDSHIGEMHVPAFHKTFPRKKILDGQSGKSSPKPNKHSGEMQISYNEKTTIKPERHSGEMQMPSQHKIFPKISQPEENVLTKPGAHTGEMHMPKISSTNYTVWSSKLRVDTSTTEKPRGSKKYEYIEGPFDGEEEIVQSIQKIKISKIHSGTSSSHDATNIVREKFVQNDPDIQNVETKPDKEFYPVGHELTDFQKFEKAYLEKMNEIVKTKIEQEEAEEQALKAQEEAMEEEIVKKKIEHDEIEQQALKAQEEVIEEEKLKETFEIGLQQYNNNITFPLPHSIVYGDPPKRNDTNTTRSRAYQAPIYQTGNSVGNCGCCGQSSCDCCAIIYPQVQQTAQIQQNSYSSSCGCCGQSSSSCGCCASGAGIGTGAGAGAGFFCFSRDTIVNTINGMKRMDQLRVDDWVLTANKSETFYQPIESWIHRMPTVFTDFLFFTLEDSRTLKITSKHFIYKTKCKESNKRIPFENLSQHPVFAEKVEIDDCLYVVLHDEPNPYFVQRRVINKTTIQQKGIYAPMTVGGDIIVNGIFSSCYNIIHQKEMHLSFFRLLDDLTSINSMLGLTSHNQNEYDLPFGIRWIVYLLEYLIPYNMLK